MDPVDRNLARRKSIVDRVADGHSPPRRGNRRTLQRLVLSLLLSATFIFGVATAARLIDAWRDATPLVGTLIAFDKTLPLPARGLTRMEWDFTRIDVRRADSFAANCVLELGVLRAGNGSFLVTGQTGHAVSVHWVGTRTTLDAANCGTDAELVMQRSDLDLLTVAPRGADLMTNAAEIGFGFESK